jgi:hypothetical protein
MLEMASLAAADNNRSGVRRLRGGEDLRHRIADRFDQLRLDPSTAERSSRLAQDARLPTALVVADRLQP